MREETEAAVMVPVGELVAGLTFETLSELLLKRPRVFERELEAAVDVRRF